MVLDGANINDTVWLLRSALHHGRQDYLLVVSFFITGLLGLSWLRALLLAGISYWLAYSCLLVLEFRDIASAGNILHWSLLCGLGVVGFVVWKRRAELTEFRLSILCALSVIGVSFALTYGDQLWLDRQISAAIERTFERHSAGSAYTLRVIDSEVPENAASGQRSLALNLESKHQRYSWDEGKFSWAWRKGVDAPWSASLVAQFGRKPFSGLYQMTLQNTKADPIVIQDGQIKFTALVEFVLSEATETESDEQDLFRRLALGPPRRASRSLEFILDHVTVTIPGVAKGGAVLSKRTVKAVKWNQGEALRLAEAGPDSPPTNIIELANFVQHHSAEEIAPLVAQWLPELLQLLELQVRGHEITAAIEMAANEAQKAQIIAKVPTVPWLVAVLVKRGWVMEAKREILACNDLDYFPLNRLMPILIDSGDADFYPLIYRGIQQTNERSYQVPDLATMPALRDFLWTHRPKRFELREGQPIWRLLLKSGHLPALIECLGQKSFWAGEFLRDDHLRLIKLEKAKLDEIRMHQNRLAFHPSLKIFIYTPAPPP
jgi:hypothetical protein